MFFELITNSRRRTGRWIQLKKSKVFTSWNLAPVHRAPSSSPAPPTGRPARVVSRVHRGVQPIRLQPPSSSSFPRGRPDGTPAPAASLPGQPEVKATAAWRMDLWKLGGLVVYLVCPA